MKSDGRKRLAPRGSNQIGNGSLDVTVVIPAFRESAVIGQVVQRSRRTLASLGVRYEVLVIDDGSLDATARVAQQAGARIVSHPYNIGNGAAVKTGIRHARGRALVFMDGDGQHRPEDIPRLLDGLKTYDMVVGARNRRTQAPAHRSIANTVYNLLATYVCDRKIDDLTSGFRVVRADIAREFLHLLPNTFSYPTTLTLAVVRSGYSLGYVPIRVLRRTGKSKIRLLSDGLRFLIIISKIATLFSPLKVFFPASLALFLLGLGYGLYKVIALGQRYGPTSAMLMTIAGVVFLMGLVSEQITQLRYDRDSEFQAGPRSK